MSQFNRAVQAQRQPGSSFKPFVYLAAMDAGFTPSTIVRTRRSNTTRATASRSGGPSNYGGDFLGPLTVRNGLEKSRNLMTVRMAAADRHEAGRRRSPRNSASPTTWAPTCRWRWAPATPRCCA